ncbi:hypothetical protein BDK92_3675 [Micromonospora pisi]|uniref:Uncharacterized protein n=1 Tax=Micromonospora pisi TaxID=589240 RepID=A0A495JKI5_9ACTN|nr:hypothetical protein [Micromonospora pisi]RKR89331.1 hypothetical protein BDK92_3675 [Micromonospora pisi]
MSIEDAKAAIRKGIEASERAKSTIRDADSHGRLAHTLALSTAHDSRHKAVERGFDCLREAEHEVDLVLRRIEVSTDAANRYLGILG